MKMFCYILWTLVIFAIAYIVKDIIPIPYAVTLGWLGGCVGMFILQRNDY